MANVGVIAAKLGATIVGQVPDVGGGAFGAARLARIVAGSATVPVPITEVTRDKLRRLAEKASTPNHQVDPVEMAARLLEQAVAAAEV